MSCGRRGRSEANSPPTRPDHPPAGLGNGRVVGRQAGVDRHDARRAEGRQAADREPRRFGEAHDP